MEASEIDAESNAVIESIYEEDKDISKNRHFIDKYDHLSWKHRNRLDMIYLYKPGRTLSTVFEGKIVKFCSKYDVFNINIGTFGFIGSGKSTLINRLAWFLDKKPWTEELLPVRQIDIAEFRRKSLTTERTNIGLKDGINIIDNRGFTEITPKVILEVQRQCEGKVSPDTKVDSTWEPNIKNAFIRKIFFQEICHMPWVIHCPVIVYRLDDEREPEVLQELIDAIYVSTSVFPVIAILFKPDQSTQNKAKPTKMDSNLIGILHDECINRKVAQFHQLHCGRVCLIPIANNDVEGEFFDIIENIGMIDLLFNCCCVGDQQMKKTMILKEAMWC